MSTNERLMALEARLHALEIRLANAEEDIEWTEDAVEVMQKERASQHVDPYSMPTISPGRTYTCVCPDNYVCMSVACPRRWTITYSGNMCSTG